MPSKGLGVCGLMTKLDGERVLKHIRAINSVDSSDATLATFITAVRDYGFEQVMIGQLVNPANVNPKDILFLTTWPEELKDRRRKMMASLHDPIARCTLRTRRPFFWHEATRHASVQARRVVDIMKDYGVSDGLTFPMHSLDSVTGGVSIGAEKIDVSRDEIAELELICSAAYYKFEALEGPFPYQLMPSLSPREAEVVQLTAAGKTNLDIADILGIAEDTVKKHMVSAREKLGALNRAHAVSQALASNQILP